MRPNPKRCGVAPAGLVLAGLVLAGLVLAGCGDDSGGTTGPAGAGEDAVVSSSSTAGAEESTTTSSAPTTSTVAVADADPLPALDPERSPIEPGRHEFTDLSHPFSIELGPGMSVASGPGWVDLVDAEGRRITFLVPTGFADPSGELRADRINDPLPELEGRADAMGLPMTGEMAWLTDFDPRLVLHAGSGLSANGGEAEVHDFTVTEVAVAAETGSGVAATHLLDDHVVTVQAGAFHRNWTIPHPGPGDLWALVTTSTPDDIASSTSWDADIVRSVQTVE